MSHILQSFFISLFIGLMIGLEREHSHDETVEPIGVRTFVLFALLGTFSAIIHENVLQFFLGFFVFGIILLSYFRSTQSARNRSNLNIATEVSAAIVFCLGYIAPFYPLVSIAISAMVLLVLVERRYLHNLARKKFKPHEIETAILLLVFTLGVLPVLPDKTIDPWQLFNPRDFGVLIVTIASIQFIGYIAIRLFGERFGIAISGFLGGLISSTSIFLMLPNTLKKHPRFYFATIASAILATVAMLTSIVLIIFVASPILFTKIIIPYLIMIAIGLLISLATLKFQKKVQPPLPTLPNPLDLPLMFRTALFIALTLILIAISKKTLGIEGMLIISFLGGLFEIQGVALAIALLFLGNDLDTKHVVIMLSTATAAGFLSKFGLLIALTPIRFSTITILLLLILLSAGGASFWVFYANQFLAF